MELGRKNYDIMIEELQRIIESGLVKPGEKLDTIENLAKRYRVGRSTVREAISHLKARGLIETRQGGGTYVRAQALETMEARQIANRQELVQLLQVWKILEIGSIELAAEYRSEADLDELARIVSLMEEAIGNEETSRVHDVNFHFAIAKATRNPLLQQMMETISAMMTRTIRDSRSLWLFSEKESAHRLFQEHYQMLLAIREQDRRGAVDIMNAHLTKVGNALIGASAAPGAEQTD
ncbi:FadR/GntR family transcriptional regulator [Paenibacillus macerans]|uniref:FadR/GntR family transcriptional regulator n=1 Tax=Paenibacillus macerans TaxID=44252 RepID=UPI002DBB1A5D|nr:FadR/GntR family transcriptional regulator [Paenibacillus macerans]MEC0328012.1 FadR/GntR family transcriptional regulator [Paenibacillus macerans]